MRRLSRREALGRLVRLPVGVSLFAALGVGRAKCERERKVIAYAGKPQRCIVLISIDSLRADHVGCYGYPRDTTPNLDALARVGTRFASAIAPSSWTIPSHMSIFSSLYPSAHSVTHVASALSPRCITLAEALKEEGYSSAGFVSNRMMVGSQYGFGQGFDLYDDYSVQLVMEVDGLDPHEGVTSERVNHVVGTWLKPHRRDKLFLFVHYWDVHYNYMPGHPYAEMFTELAYNGPFRNRVSVLSIREGMDKQDLEQAKALYDGEIRRVDEHIGLLVRQLQDLGMWEDTLFVVLSDHGDEFLDHGRSGHGHTLYDELLKVPLIFVGPGIPKGRTVNSQVNLVDVYPTILELSGVNCIWPIQGMSLTELMLRDSPERRTVFSETQLDGPLLRCARTRSAKYIVNQGGSNETYDLEADPVEQNSLADSDPAYLLHLQDQLSCFVSECREIRRVLGILGQQPKRSLDQQTLERLRSLGYLK